MVAPAVIILVVILGAGGMVVCGAAVMRFYGDVEQDPNFNSRSPEQDAYMREVRERNWGRLPRLGEQKFLRPPNQHLAHAPMSPT